MKKRVLFVSEFTGLNTGYSVYTNELMKRLYATGKYELAELACYCPTDFHGLKDIPWKVYPNLPSNDQERAIYESSPTAEFGEWKFESVCLDFFPDIVCSIRDFWMDAWIDLSPFRRFYKTVMMPTVDGSPQHPDWIDLYKSTDVVLAYNDWSLELLRKEGGGLINLHKSAPPSADSEQFKFVSDKREHKSQLGIDPDTFIIGMVARNQRRKLFPDLADAFKLLLSKLSAKQREKTFLYWHTAYPDLGWMIPQYIKNNGLSSKILFTYICQNCKYFMPSFYRDVRSVCPNCKTGSMVFPFVQNGVGRDELGVIMGIFDAYVQYVTNEGFGLPIVEAAFCGNPVFATNYSAMEDTLEKLSCFKIKPKTLIYECETGRKLAIPDNEDFVNQLVSYINQPEGMKNQFRNKVYNLAKKHYSSWDDITKIWIEGIDSAKNDSEKWDIGPNMVSPIQQIPSPEQMPDEKFVAWAIKNVIGNLGLANRFIGLKFYRDLLWGRTNDLRPDIIYGDMSHLGHRPKYAPMDRNKLVENLNKIREKNNFWENMRWQRIQNKS